MSARHASPLRRLDWRFVLPTDTPDLGEIVILGGGDAVIDEARRTGIARVIHRALPVAGPVDAVIALGGGDVDIDAAAAALRPGGALYWEIARDATSWRSRSPRRVRARLRAAGLRPVATWWARPSFDRIRILLPLDRPHPLRWYIDRVFGAATASQRLVELGLRLATGLDGRRFARLVPAYVLTAVREPADPPRRPVIDDVGLPPGISAAALPIVITGGEGDWSRVTMLPFEPHATEPTAVLKLPRLALFNDQTRNERDTLVELRERLPPELRPTIPRSLGSAEWQGLAVTAETYAPGRSLFATINRSGTSTSRRIRALELATAWLTDVHRQTGTMPDDPARLPQLVREPLDRYRATFGTRADETALFERLERETASLPASTQLVPRHDDLGPWNIFVADGRPTVIDWEVARWGTPFVDLLYHVMHWSFTVRRTRTEAERRRIVLDLATGAGEDRLASAAHEAIMGYARAVGLTPGSARSFLALMCIEQAVARAERLRALGQLPADPRDENRYVGYVEVLAAAGLSGPSAAGEP
jgi:hypothetical protein